MAKVTTVKRARNDQGECGKCHAPLPAGSAYRHFSPGFRGPKHVRCMKTDCTPRRSELTTSKLSQAYAAQEDAHNAIDDADSFDMLKDAVSAAEESGREVADEYEDAVTNAPMLEDQVRETIDALSDWCEELAGFDPDEPDKPEEDPELTREENQEIINDYEIEWREAFDQAKDEARDLIDSLEV